MNQDKELVTILAKEKETEKAYLLKMTGINRVSGLPVELLTWWPKSQVSVPEDATEIEVPKWLLDKKIEEAFGSLAIVEMN
jgi:hypothetical protein